MFKINFDLAYILILHELGVFYVFPTGKVTRNFETSDNLAKGMT